MRILQINKFYYHRRGAETYLFNLINLLQDHGHEVAVFAMDHPDNEPSVYSKYFVSNIELGEPNKLAWWEQLQIAGRVVWNKEAQDKLEALLIDFKPDIAHIHNIYHQLSPSILRTLQRHQVHIVQTLHDYKLLCPNYRLFTAGELCDRCRNGGYHNAIRYRCIKESYSASALASFEQYCHKAMRIYEDSVHCFISPSHFLRNKIREWNIGLRHLRLVPNFLPIQLINPVYTHSNYFLYLGGGAVEKGIDLLLDSFKKIHYDIPLHLAGFGLEPYKAEFIASCHPVTILNQLTPQQIAAEIKGAKAIIVPSRWYENCPYSVLEAFAHGKPVIAANHGGLPELVIPGKTGWLFQANNSESLAKTLQFVQDLPDNSIAQLGQSARQWAEQHHNSEKHYQILYEIYSHYSNQHSK